MSDSPDPSLTVPTQLLLAQKIANITDSSVRIPFTKIKLGLDFILGLIPGIGDFIMFLVATSLVVLGKQIGMPTFLLLKMVRNSLVDFLLGLIPLVGDIVDIFYKSNQKNVRIMEKWWLSENYQALGKDTQRKLDEWEQANS